MRRALGLTLTLAEVAAIVANLFALALLASALGWPDRYGFTCHGAGCFFAYPWHSPALLRHGDGRELLLFATIWGAGLIPVACGWWIRPITIRLSLPLSTRPSR